MGEKPVRVVLYGVVAGLLGAAVWAGIAYQFNYEIGWIAWLIGGVVGFAVGAAGGLGNAAAVFAFVITVLAICGGKVSVVYVETGQYIEEELASKLTMETYNELQEDARLFAQLRSKAEYPRFMVERDYTEARNPAEVTPEEIAGFESEDVPMLREYQTDRPSYETWRAEHLASLQAVKTALRSQFSYWEMLKASLGLLDIVFFILAVTTAYRVPLSMGGEGA